MLEAELKILHEERAEDARGRNAEEERMNDLTNQKHFNSSHQSAYVLAAWQRYCESTRTPCQTLACKTMPLADRHIPSYSVSDGDYQSPALGLMVTMCAGRAAGTRDAATTAPPPILFPEQVPARGAPRSPALG